MRNTYRPPGKDGIRFRLNRKLGRVATVGLAVLLLCSGADLRASTRSVSDPQVGDTLLVGRGRELLRAGKYAILMDTLHGVFPAVAARGDTATLVHLHALLGPAYRRLGLDSLATHHSQRGYRLASATADDRLLFAAGRRYAYDLQQRELLDSALLLANRVVEIATGLGGRRERVGAHGLRASIHKWRDEYELALKDYAVIRSLEAGAPSLAFTNNLATLYVNLGRPDSAVHYYRQTLLSARRLNNPTLELAALRGLGYAHLRSPDLDTTDHYQAAWMAVRDSLMSRENRATALAARERFEASAREVEIERQRLIVQKRTGQLRALAVLSLLILLAGLVYYRLSRQLAKESEKNETLAIANQNLVEEIQHRTDNQLQMIQAVLGMDADRGEVSA